MHCLPAHRGEEVSATILEDRRSVVWHEAGNRLHSQKALVEFLLLGQITVLSRRLALCAALRAFVSRARGSNWP